MRCPNCGAFVPPGSSRCPQCGTQLFPTENDAGRANSPRVESPSGRPGPRSGRGIGLGELLNRSWSVLADHLGLLWAGLFAVLIPTALLFIVLGGGGLFTVSRMMLQHIIPSPAEMIGLRTGILAAMLIYIVVLPYSVGGLAGTVLDALSPSTAFSGFNFFSNGIRYYWRTWGFILLSLLVGFAFGLVTGIGTLIISFVSHPLAFVWVFAVNLAALSLNFFWLPAVYIDERGQFDALASAFRVTFVEGGWLQALGFVFLLTVGGLLILFVGGLLAAFIVGILIIFLGLLFLSVLYMVGAFVGYEADALPTPGTPAPAASGKGLWIAAAVLVLLAVLTWAARTHRTQPLSPPPRISTPSRTTAPAVSPPVTESAVPSTVPAALTPGKPFTFAEAVTDLAPAGRDLWVTLAPRPALPPDRVLLFAPATGRTLATLGLTGAGTVLAGAPDGSLDLAVPGTLVVHRANGESTHRLPAGVEPRGLAPVSSSAVWVACRPTTGGELEVGLDTFGSGGSFPLRPLTGTANERLLTLVASPGGVWALTGPRPVLYWVPTSGTAKAFPVDAQDLNALGVNATGIGWLSGTLTDGQPAVWPIRPGRAPGTPVSLPSPVNMVSSGLAVTASGRGYVAFSALGGAHGLPGVAVVSPSGSVSTTLLPLGSLPGGGVGPLALSRRAVLYAAVPFSHAVFPLTGLR